MGLLLALAVEGTSGCCVCKRVYNLHEGTFWTDYYTCYCRLMLDFGYYSLPFSHIQMSWLQVSIAQGKKYRDNLG